MERQSTPIIVGERVTLREYTNQDLQLVLSVVDDPLIPLITSVPAGGDAIAAEAYIERQRSRAVLGGRIPIRRSRQHLRLRGRSGRPDVQGLTKRAGKRRVLDLSSIPSARIRDIRASGALRMGNAAAADTAAGALRGTMERRLLASS